MKNTEEHQQRVERIRKVIECTLAGWLPEEVGQYEQAQREEKLHKAVDAFLVRHPEWKPENGATAPTSAPVASQQVITDSGMKKRCIKALGPHCFQNAGDAYAAAYAKYDPSRLAKQAAGASQNATTGTDGDIDADALAKAREAARAAKDASPERYAHIIN